MKLPIEEIPKFIRQNRLPYWEIIQNSNVIFSTNHESDLEASIGDFIEKTKDLAVGEYLFRGKKDVKNPNNAYHKTDFSVNNYYGTIPTTQQTTAQPMPTQDIDKMIQARADELFQKRVLIEMCDDHKKRIKDLEDTVKELLKCVEAIVESTSSKKDNQIFKDLFSHAGKKVIDSDVVSNVVNGVKRNPLA